MASTTATKAALAALAGAYGESRAELTPARVAVFTSALADLGDAELAAATQAVIRTSKWMPTPADILAAARPRISAEEAWAETLHMVHRHGRMGRRDAAWSSPLISAVVETIGWSTLCDMEAGSVSYYGAMFRRAFDTLDKRQHLRSAGTISFTCAACGRVGCSCSKLQIEKGDVRNGQADE